MTTYRIRPLAWTKDAWIQFCVPSPFIGYTVFQSGRWEASIFGSVSGPHGEAGNMAAARAACESHWRGVLMAALEPVEGK